MDTSANDKVDIVLIDNKGGVIIGVLLMDNVVDNDLFLVPSKPCSPLNQENDQTGSSRLW